MKTRALVLCKDPWHPAETVRSGLAGLHEFGFDFEFLEDTTPWSPELLKTFAMVVLAKANIISATDPRPWLEPGSEAGFQKHLSRGRGLLVVHGGISRYGELPLMRHAMGGAFLSHPPECEVTLEPKASHFLGRELGSFTVRDEHYIMAFEGKETDVFLHSRSRHGVQPAGWTRIVDGGRVCVLTPGHPVEVWRHPGFKQIFAKALQWTASGN